jgi:hypothetical protein
MPKTYYCDCKRYCDGQQRVISKSTFFAHKKYRDPLSQFSAEFREFLNSVPVLPHLVAARTYRSSRKRSSGTSDQTCGTTSGPRNKRTRLPEDNSGNHRIHAGGASLSAGDNPAPSPREDLPSGRATLFLGNRTDLESPSSNPPEDVLGNLSPCDALSSDGSLADNPDPSHRADYSDATQLPSSGGPRAQLIHANHGTIPNCQT